MTTEEYKKISEAMEKMEDRILNSIEKWGEDLTDLIKQTPQ